MSKMNPPMMNADCDTLIDLIPDYAFGLATTTDARLVEANLSRCPEAAQQLDEYQQIQASLRAGVPQIDLPAALEDRLMAALTVPAAPRRVALPARRPISRAWLAVAAAVLALVISNLYWITRVNSVNPVPPAPDSRFAVQNTASLRWARLPPSQQGATAAALLMWNADSKTGLLCVWGLPKPETGKTYMVWLTRGDSFARAGKIYVDDQGRGALVFQISAPIDQYTWANITTEPEPGSPSPTGNPIVAGKLPV